MPLQFKVDVLEVLKEKGYTTYTLRKNNILSQSTMQKLREGKGVAWENIERLCMLLNCQPGDILEYVPDSTLQAAKDAINDATDDAFCAALYKEYQADPDKGQAVSIEDAAKMLEQS